MPRRATRLLALAAALTGVACGEAAASARKQGSRAQGRRLILVGHSTSGLHARLYCEEYREEVAGLVLVDSASERQLGSVAV